MGIQVPYEFFSTFNEIKYYDDPHKYYVDGHEFISTTTLIHKYQESFDEDYWLSVKAKEYGLKLHELKRVWNFLNKKGTLKGSIVHAYAENLFHNKIFEYPKQQILDEFGFDPILDEYEIIKKHVNDFHRDSLGKLIPIRTEFVVYDKDSLIAGMVDMLFYNVKKQEFQIFDWKTNKILTKENKNKHLLDKLYVIEDCDLEIYSLQLEIYKQIIQKNCGIRLGSSYIVWFSHNNSSYEIIKTRDREYYAKQIISDRVAKK